MEPAGLAAEQAETEQALRESRTRLQVAIEAAGLGTWDLDLRGSGVAVVSPRFAHMLGFPPDHTTLPPDEWQSLLPLDLMRVQDALAAAVERHTPFELEYRFFPRGSGEERWLYARGTVDRDEAGRPLRFIGVAMDVTERKRAEAALRESETRYRVLFDSIDVGFCVIELLFDDAGHATDYRFLEVNPAFEQQTGLGDAVGRTMRSLAPAHEAHWFEIYGRVALTGEPIRFENPARALGDRWFDVYAFRVGRAEQRRVAILFTDITGRRRAEERLRHAERLEAVGALAGGMAHEANNQMSVVLGFADFLLRRSDLPADVLHDVEQMRRAAERTALVTSQLLAFGRRQILRPSVMDLNVAVRELAPVLRRILREDSELTLDLAEGLGRIRADVRQMDQVLVNLTLNARDAMPRGGRLTVRTRDVELAGREREMGPGEPVRPGPYVCLEVRDTGDGIPRDIRGRIFEPFFTTKQTGEGSGLGLSSVYGIVRQSGGQIRVESEPGAGARFIIHLPRVDEPLPAPGTPALEPPARMGASVLIVEDEPAVRDMMARTLSQAGYRVLQAENGLAALEAIAADGAPPDLVVTDVAMPRMGGKMLARALRARFPRLPVIFTSGYPDGETALRQALQPGETFLQKPFSPEELARAVRASRD